MIFLVVPSSLYAIPYKLGIKKKKRKLLLELYYNVLRQEKQELLPALLSF